MRLCARRLRGALRKVTASPEPTWFNKALRPCCCQRGSGAVSSRRVDKIHTARRKGARLTSPTTLPGGKHGRIDVAASFLAYESAVSRQNVTPLPWNGVGSTSLSFKQAIMRPSVIAAGSFSGSCAGSSFGASPMACWTRLNEVPLIDWRLAALRRRCASCGVSARHTFLGANFPAGSEEGRFSS